jgi:hypothetical protein
MNTKDKDIRDALARKEVATVSKIVLLHHKSEIDTDQTAHDYKTKTVCAILTGNTVNENIDFNIPDRHKYRTNRVSKFRLYHLDKFRLFFTCMGEKNHIPWEEDGIPAWIYHFGVDLVKTNTEWYKDPACINIVKNQFIFIG